MQAELEQPFVPFQTAFASFGDTEILSVTFSLKNTVEQSSDGCGINLIKVCDSDTLLPVTAARLEWQFCSHRYSVSDTDVSEAFNVDLVDEGGNIVAIKIEVHSDFVSAANDFWLYGTVDGQNVLLARGRIYVVMLNPHSDDPVIDGEEWQTVEW